MDNKLILAGIEYLFIFIIKPRWLGG